jgi:hypothetical protein
MQRNSILVALSIAAVAGCSKPNGTSVASADTLSRIAPTPMNDAAAAVPPETVFVTTVRAPAPRRPHRDEEPRPSAGVAQAPDRPQRGHGTIESGTDIRTTLIDSIHSAYNGLGDPIRATINADVSVNGRVVIPAGSVVTFRVSAIQPAGSRGVKGTLDMTAESVLIDGRAYPVDGVGTDYDFEMRARPVNAGDVVTAVGGAAIGAIIGHVLGGKTGTIVGAVGGGAAGTAVAAKNADRDIIVHAGTPLTLSLLGPFER